MLLNVAKGDPGCRWPLCHTVTLAGLWGWHLAACLLTCCPCMTTNMNMLQITTHTSDVEGAGTSAHVNMVLSGTAGSSSSLDLSHPSSISHSDKGTGPADGSRSGFGRGDAAAFMVRCAPLGDLQQLVVWHDSSGPQPAWHLAYVEVAELSSGKVRALTAALQTMYFLLFAILCCSSGDCSCSVQASHVCVIWTHAARTEAV
jgi:hypothetical protein